MQQSARVVAVLGPTNTGKTHYAIERMLAHRTGIIGLPLRLLAREVYDKIVALRGPSVVALVTGEERIVPPRTKYWICTVEAMPQAMGLDFVAIDEVQLCADPERGHVFTDRIIHMRGLHETLFLGAGTMRKVISDLVPEAQFMRRDRLSTLSYTGSKKISRMPARSAIVCFSVDNLYAIAELIRRQKGGAAVVMGALSPRTRNAQVELYQNGDVDYLVATDAIGMGLNLDIDHVAFAGLSKFDGRRMRDLAPNELGQIAGRAGRGMSDGSFGVTGEAPPLDEGMAAAIVENRFTPISKLQWRNSDLNFSSIDALMHSLSISSQDDLLVKAREADDYLALQALWQSEDIRQQVQHPEHVRLLWDICRIPDFRGISLAEHVSLLSSVFGHLQGNRHLPNDWLAGHLKRIDRVEGDIDTLSMRLAFVRTWTYVSQRSGWVDDENHWRETTRAVEDRLSDALHMRLTQRFVDRRTSVLLRRLKQKEALLAEVNENSEVTVEGEFVGRLEGFQFRQDKDATGQEAKTIKSAALQALTPHFHLRADRFYNAPDTEIDFTEQGGLMWGTQAIGKLVSGDDILKPRITVFVDDEAGADVTQKVQRRLQHFIDRKIASLFEPLINLQRDETLTGLARGFAYRMVEGFGILPRAQVAEDVKSLDQDARGALRKHGVRFGQFTVFMPLLLKPAPTRLRLVLWSLSKGLQTFSEAPPPGLVTVPVDAHAESGHDTICGYRNAGTRAIRIDMLERLADMLRGENSRTGFEAKADMLSITGMTLEQFADLMQGLGYQAAKAERVKTKAAQDPVASATPEVDKPEISAALPEKVAFEPVDAAQEAASDVNPAKVEPSAAEALSSGSERTETLHEEEQPAASIAQADSQSAPAQSQSAETIEPELEVFYTFTWGHVAKKQSPPRHNKPKHRAGDEKQARKSKGKQKPSRDKKGPKTFAAKPEKTQKIDPDNPFAAALMGLKTQDR